MLAGAAAVLAATYAAAAVATGPGGGEGNGRIPPKAANAPTGTTLPAAPLTVRLEQITTAAQPLAVVARPRDDALYVVEKEGRIRVLRDGRLEARPLLDIVARVSSENERGLLGLAFPPSAAPLAYIDYTDRQGAVVVSELPFDGESMDIGRERVLLRVPKPFNEHNAGTIVFATDGSLYIGIGDGGGFGDRFNNAQRTDVLLGKVLRIVPTETAGKPYAIPADNPFVPKKASLSPVRGRAEVWAYGLRNPWRISIDPATGDLWVPDVGQNSFEEINRIPARVAGANLGWRLREGKQTFKGARPTGATDPVYDYPHKDGRCAVAGGVRYRGLELAALRGWYVFGDVCTGQLAALHDEGGMWRPYSLGARISYLTSFGTDNDGELYATSLEGGVYRLTAR